MLDVGQNQKNREIIMSKRIKLSRIRPRIKLPDNYWKTNPDSFAKIENEMKRQRQALPEAEVIDCLMQDGWTFAEIMEMRSRLKGDSIFKCWN
jgi:hypothetical protein